VLPLPPCAIAATARMRKMTTSITSRVRSILTDALMLHTERPNTMASAARLKIHHGTLTWNVEMK
jgi:hypothetical protein